MTKIRIVDWFEIPTSDFERAIKFYNRIFSVELVRGEAKNYQMAFFLHGEPGGALVKSEKGSLYQPSDKGPIIFFNGGDDLNEVMEKVEKAGGEVLVPKTFISQEIGYFGLFIDSEGNKIGLHSS